MGEPVGHHWTFRAMGSPCELQCHVPPSLDAEHVYALAAAEVERLEARYSRYREDSFLSQINRVAEAGGRIEVDEETAGLLRYADTCYRQSDGLFDITSGLLRKAWRFDRDELPDPDRITALLRRVGWDRVNWTGSTLHFSPGMEIDFGGIVKEYAADRVASLCASAGVRHGMINLGGDIRILGPQPDGSPWRIGVRDPREPGAVLGVLTLTEGGIASSGDYERGITVGGVRFGHILNPTTGWPVSFLRAVTVVGELCLVAGSASTIAMLKGESGPSWLQALGLPHLWMDHRGHAGGSLEAAAASDRG